MEDRASPENGKAPREEVANERPTRRAADRQRKIQLLAAGSLALLLFLLAWVPGVGFPEPAPPPEKPDPSSWSDSRLTLAYLGHATVLMRFCGVTILTDPAFFDRVGVEFGPWMLGPKRLVRVALGPREIPPPDVVLVSHAHMDSLDFPSLRALPRKTTLVVPRNTSSLVRDMGFRRTVELSWGESLSVGSVEIEAVEVRHWGKRWPWDPWRGYNGYVLRGGGTSLLFAPDTAYSTRLSETARKEGVEVFVLGNGAYDPWIRNHANPEEVWRMFRDSGARYLVPVHWDTFRLGKEPVGDAMRRLLEAAGPESEKVVVRRIGQTWQLPRELSCASERIR
ncbi:MAG: hypothetical protein KatS3mg076_0041 [Candidatus Binatia bacterium]|nr:MAG: hypothetical protein KatS3mg076_0041 [Candidatus Binatia bacterium]